MESLERRNLLAGDGFHNFIDPADVNNDEAVSAADALTIINSLNRNQVSGEELGSTSDSYWDVNDDGYASAVDALMVINQLNHGLASTTGELEARLSGASGERAKVEFEQSGQTRKLEVKVQNAASSSTLSVSINGATVGIVTTDANGRGRIELLEFISAGQLLSSVNAGDTVAITGLGSSVLSRGDDEFRIGESDDHVIDHDDNGINHVDDSFAGDLDDGVNSNQNPPIAPVTTGSLYGEWRAVLTGAGSGSAEFDRESRESDFKVEVRGLAPNATLPVSINGTVVSQLRTDSRGQGKLKFEVGDDDYRPYPANFPAIVSGSTIQVGSSLAGTFAIDSYGNDDHDDDRDHDDDHDD
jgi:hypothetical protein